MADLDHYFTADEPAIEGERRPLRTVLADREVTVETAGGIFSPGGLDKATAILLDEVPAPPPAGTALDLGCGWGPIALALALRSPGLPACASARRQPSFFRVDAWVDDCVGETSVNVKQAYEAERARKRLAAVLALRAALDHAQDDLARPDRGLEHGGDGEQEADRLVHLDGFYRDLIQRETIKLSREAA